MDRPIVALLRTEGHDVAYVAEMAPGITDVEILELARADNALVRTQDKDFGELVFRQGLATQGVVLLRMAGLTSVEKAKLVTTAIRSHGDEFPQSFVVISQASIRIRTL